jgi:hypothetical protein
VKIKYVGPSAARLLPGGVEVARGGVIEVNDKLGAALVASAHWEKAVAKPPKRKAVK